MLDEDKSLGEEENGAGAARALLCVVRDYKVPADDLQKKKKKKVTCGGEEGRESYNPKMVGEKNLFLWTPCSLFSSASLLFFFFFFFFFSLSQH